MKTSLWKRLTNLWKLSEYKPSDKETEQILKTGDKISTLYKPAQIIKMTTASDKFLNKK